MVPVVWLVPILIFCVVAENVTAPVADNVAPCKIAPVIMLPPFTLPVADIRPGVVTLPAAMLPVTLSALTTLLVRLRPAALRLPPVMLPVPVT